MAETAAGVRDEARSIEAEARRLLMRWIALMPDIALDPGSQDPAAEVTAAMLKALASLEAVQAAPDWWILDRLGPKPPVRLHG